MRRRILTAALLLLAVGLANLAAQDAAAPTSAYTSGRYSFTLQAPTFDALGAGRAGVIAAFSAPAEEGFAANMSVMIQQISMTRDDYKAVLIGGIEKAGLTINRSDTLKVGPHDALRLDYQGTLDQRDLRFLALAVVEKNRVVLVTCKSLQKNFAKYEAAFKAALDSYQPAP
ncbi:MAG: hypothetical protein WD042_06740 [Phycisphaeraceae bacterium]